MRFFFFFILSLLILSCKSNKKAILLSINIPENLCAYIDGKETVVADAKPEKTLLLFYDERECIPCDYAHLTSWGRFFEYSNKKPDRLAVKIIFSIKDRARIQEFEDCSLIYTLESPVFLDSLGAFRALNPLPEFKKNVTVSVLNAAGEVLATNMFLKRGEEKDFANEINALLK